MSTKILPLLLLAATPVLVACPDTEPSCDPGFVLVDDGTLCVPVDGGTTDSGTDADAGDAGDADAGDAGDSAVDAGPCGMECTGTTPLCNTTTGMCVACIGDTDCTDLTAPQCDTTAGTCGACDADDACVGRTGTLVCAPRGPNQGACVECSAAARDACDLATSGERDVCDAATNTCTAEAPESANTCSPCVSDLQCQPGQLCVTTEFNAGAAMTPVDGFFCLWTEGAASPGPAGSCSANGRPYIRRRPDITSVDGTLEIVCDLAVSTCPAQNDFRDTRCSDGGAPEMPVDTMCGVSSLEDAYCVDRDTGGGFDYRCTTRCLSPDDCPADVGCDTPTQHCLL